MSSSKINVAKQAIDYAIESGKSDPRYTTLLKILFALDISLKDFFSSRSLS
mgnify:CR=1 FL=1